MYTASRIATAAVLSMATSCGGASPVPPAKSPAPLAEPFHAAPVDKPVTEAPAPERKRPAVPEGWVEVTRPGGFAVHMPAEPKRTDLDVPLESGRKQKLTLFTATAGQTQFAISRSDVTPSRQGRTSKQFLDAARDALSKKLGNVSEDLAVTATDQAGAEIIGRQFALHDDRTGVWVNAVVYLCGMESWQVLVASPSKEQQADFITVRDSFQLLKTCGERW